MAPVFRMRNVLARLLHPFPRFSLVAGQHYSPLDAKAEALGVPHVEQVFSENAAARAIGAALGAFLRDGEAERALKKAYHIAFEHRIRTLALRLDPAENHGFDPVPLPDGAHPLDEAASTVLATVAPQAADLKIRGLARLRRRQWSRALAWASALIASSVWLLVRYGRRKVVPRRIPVLACDNCRESYWLRLRRAAMAEGCWQDDQMAVLVGDAPVEPFTRLPVVHIGDLRLPRRQWLLEVVIPAFSLVRRVLGEMIRNSGDAVALEIAGQCLNLACSSLRFQRTGYGLRWRYILDAAEHDPAHILKAIVGRRHGGKAVRLPRTISDTAGTQLSFFGYDIFLSSGPYQERSYGRTWKPGAETASLGLVRSDGNAQAEEPVAAEYAASILERIAAGKRMAVFFGPGSVPGVFRQARDVMDIVVRVLSARDDWFLVVKPKGSDHLNEVFAADPRYAGWTRSVDTIFVRYPSEGQEVCSSGWLIRHMTVGTGSFGSVPIEALTRGKPYFVHYPALQPTPLRTKLADAGLLHQGVQEFESAFAAFVAEPERSGFPFDWFREQFDPFGDDRALERLAAFLFGGRTDGLAIGTATPERMECSS